MAESTGRKLRLKIGPTIIAAIRTKKVLMDKGVVDITTSDSAGWRTLSSVMGQKSLSITFDGISSDNILKKKVMSMDDISIPDLKIEFSDGSNFVGSFILTDLEETGTYDNAITFSGTLLSAKHQTKPTVVASDFVLAGPPQ